MNNQRFALLLYEFADLEDILGVAWKPIALRKAARTIETLRDDIQDIYAKGGIDALLEIPGVGQGIAAKAVEFLETGTFEDLVKTRKKLPPGIVDLMHVRGIGPKRVKEFYGKLKIKSIDELEAAARAGKIQRLEGFGKKSEDEILQSIEFLRKGQERQLLGIALPIARELEEAMRKVKGVTNVAIAGSVRRRRETVKDIDILAVARDPAAMMSAFTSLPNVVKITGKGDTKSSVILREGLNADLRVVPQRSFGAALQYFTGSVDHNVRVRQEALKQGMTLNEYGLFTLKDKTYVCGQEEEHIYKRLGIPYVPPEIRENRGEFDVKTVPSLMPYDGLRGDLHMHTIWSDGTGTPERMVEAARQLGYDYLAITDHSKSQVQANGMDEKRLRKYIEEIRALQKKNKDIHVFVGAEVDILNDGSLDYSDALLKELDIVIASVHSGFTMDQKKMTRRILKAMENEYVTILGHPTGRLLNQRDGYPLDTDAVFDAAKRHDVVLEINANPPRLDLSDMLCRRAKEAGCTFAVNTDAHHPDQLRYSEYGIATARRGWLEAADILNSLSLKKIQKVLQQ